MIKERGGSASTENLNNGIHDVFLDSEQIGFLWETIGNSEHFKRHNRNREKLVKLAALHANQIVPYQEIQNHFGYTGARYTHVMASIHTMFLQSRNLFNTNNSPLSEFELLTVRWSGAIIVPNNDHKIFRLPVLNVEPLESFAENPDWWEPYVALRQTFKRNGQVDISNVVTPASMDYLMNLFGEIDLRYNHEAIFKRTLISEAAMAGVELSIRKHKVVDMKMIE